MHLHHYLISYLKPEYLTRLAGYFMNRLVSRSIDDLRNNDTLDSQDQAARSDFSSVSRSNSLSSSHEETAFILSNSPRILSRSTESSSSSSMDKSLSASDEIKATLSLSSSLRTLPLSSSSKDEKSSVSMSGSLSASDDVVQSEDVFLGVHLVGACGRQNDRLIFPDVISSSSSLSNPYPERQHDLSQAGNYTEDADTELINDSEACDTESTKKVDHPNDIIVPVRIASSSSSSSDLFADNESSDAEGFTVVGKKGNKARKTHPVEHFLNSLHLTRQEGGLQEGHAIAKHVGTPTITQSTFDNVYDAQEFTYETLLANK